MSTAMKRPAGCESPPSLSSLSSSGCSNAETYSSYHKGARHEDLKVELLGKVIYDSPLVFERLQVNKIPDSLINERNAAYHTENALHLSSLHETVRDASGIPEDETNATKLKAKRQREIDMYEPLENIFAWISADGPRKITRINRPMAPPPAHETVGESYTPGFPRIIPDFTLAANVEAAGAQTSAAQTKTKSVFWHDRDGFCEVKVLEIEGQQPSGYETVKTVIAQSADYARLHMSTRPFLLFSVGLIVTGLTFRVGIFDRGGVLLSPMHNIYDDSDGSGVDLDAKMFIRVVYSMTNRLSAVDLGQDPTVRYLPPGDMAQELDTHGTNVDVNRDAAGFPSFIIEPLSSDRRSWCTVGPPIWTSLSLIGRGGVVWRVLELYNGRMLRGSYRILKTSWRSSGRHAEADIWNRVRGEHAGLAKVVHGADVVDRSVADKPVITVLYLRHGRMDGLDPNGIPTLHRIVFETVGRPLWSYNTVLELLSGIRAALDAHRFLYDQGILHRDISAGNIFLAEQPDGTGPRAGGFLSDLDLAYVDGSVVEARTYHEKDVGPVIRNRDPRTATVSYTEPTLRTHTSFSDEEHKGAPMTGTLQFMAVELLTGMLSHSPVAHTAAHDIESFAYVLGYCVLRHIRTAVAEDKKAFPVVDQAFKDRFGRVVLKDIIDERETYKVLTWFRKTEKPKEAVDAVLAHLPKPLSRLMLVLADELSRISNTRLNMQFETRQDLALDSPSLPPTLQPEPPALTHEWFLDAVDTAIQGMEDLKKLEERPAKKVRRG